MRTSLSYRPGRVNSQFLRRSLAVVARREALRRRLARDRFKRMAKKPLALKIIPLLFAWGAATSLARGADCDRECLRGFVTQYLSAMAAHNPDALPLASNVRFTEDAKEIKLGNGLWKNVSKIATYRQDILDVRQGMAASQVIVEEAGTPVMLVLRLKIADKKISEIETQVTRNRSDGAIFNISAIQTPSKAMNLVPERAQLNSREEAAKIAQSYPAGLKVGSFVEVDAPFAPDAYRLENGSIMAGPGCSRPGCENIKAQNIIKHPAITTRVAAVDEELGIVLLRMNFGDTGSYGQGNALIVWEAFKVYGGQIHAVEAFRKVMPASMGSGWD